MRWIGPAPGEYQPPFQQAAETIAGALLEPRRRDEMLIEAALRIAPEIVDPAEWEVLAERMKPIFERRGVPFEFLGAGRGARADLPILEALGLTRPGEVVARRPEDMAQVGPFAEGVDVYGPPALSPLGETLLGWPIERVRDVMEMMPEPPKREVPRRTLAEAVEEKRTMDKLFPGARTEIKHDPTTGYFITHEPLPLEDQFAYEYVNAPGIDEKERRIRVEMLASPDTKTVETTVAIHLLDKAGRTIRTIPKPPVERDPVVGMDINREQRMIAEAVFREAQKIMKRTIEAKHYGKVIVDAFGNYTYQWHKDYGHLADDLYAEAIRKASQQFEAGKVPVPRELLKWKGPKGFEKERPRAKEKEEAEARYNEMIDIWKRITR